MNFDVVPATSSLADTGKDGGRMQDMVLAGYQRLASVMKIPVCLNLIPELVDCVVVACTR